MLTKKLQCFFSFTVIMTFLLPLQSALAEIHENLNNESSPLGSNLDGVRSYSPEWVYVDQFTRARPWIAGSCSGTWDTGQVLTLDANGWVANAPSGVCPHTLMLDAVNGKYPAGKYVLLWDGQGTFNLKNDGKNLTVTGPGRATFDVITPSNSGVDLWIASNTVGNHIRNIRVLMPGGMCGVSKTTLNPFKGCQTARGGEGTCATGETCFDYEEIYFNRFTDKTKLMETKTVFHPSYLEKLKNYRTLRFMDWMSVNNSPLKTWSERTHLSDHIGQYSNDYGQPIEYMVALSNLLNTDSWFTIPHQSDNAYSTEMATLVKSLMHGNLKAYVEYSNETWNGQFSQAAYVQNQGVAQGLPGLNNYEKGRYYFTNRTAEIASLWKAVFADHPERIVGVLASQSVSSYWTDKMLGYNNAADKLDAFAIAPYFGGYIGSAANAPTVQAWSLNQLFAELTGTGTLGGANAITRAALDMTAHKVVATKYGVEMLAYEGGQHLVGVGTAQSNTAITTLFNNANRDPRMKEVYRQYLEKWKLAGAQLFVHFNSASTYSKFGSWGAMWYQTQPRVEAPKYDALMTFIEGNPCWWTNCETDGPIPAPTPLVMEDDFNSYAAGADPTGMVDTGSNFSLMENQALFSVATVGSEKVFGTSQSKNNIHSHFVNAKSADVSKYVFTGKMMFNHPNASIGVTFLSAYPKNDAYYSLQSVYSTQNKENKSARHSFRLSSRGYGDCVGNTDSDLIPEKNKWYYFKIESSALATDTTVKAKIWEEGQTEPSTYQASCVAQDDERALKGTVGVWTSGVGGKYFDNFKVEELE